MELQRIKATQHIFDISAPAGLYNSNVVTLGARATDGTYSVAAPVSTADVGMVVVADIGLSYEIEKKMKDKVIATGEIVRAYMMELGNKIGVPVANILATSALAVGKVVVPKAANLQLECLASLEGSEVLAFVIESLYTKNGNAMVLLRCIKTEK
jgi:hypothetical protein